MEKEENLLAAYAVYSNIYNNQAKSSAKILSSFVKYIIIEKKLQEYTESIMVEYLNELFGFKIPNTLIKSISKNIKEVKRNNGSYKVLQPVTFDKDLIDKMNTASNLNEKLIDKLVMFAEKNNNKKLNSNEKQILIKNFVDFLLIESDYGTRNNKEIISKFLLSIEGNETYINQINLIRSGAILYTGISYELDNIPKPQGTQRIYCATEILFNLIGYNGDIYKKLANEFWQLIKEAQKKGIKIQLMCFESTKLEIDNYFKRAEHYIEEGKIYFQKQQALKNILDGCEQKSDVILKREEFYKKMKYNYGVIFEKGINYYTDDLNSYNIESTEYDGENEKDIKYISNIRKLRKNSMYKNYMECQYLFITNSNAVFDIQNKEFMKEYNTCIKYAINMSTYSNILWLYLKKGFGSSCEYMHLDTIVKAKIILSNTVTSKLACDYDNAVERYKNGNLSEEQLRLAIGKIRESSELPEDITNEKYDEAMLFCLDDIELYMEELDQNKVTIKKQMEENRKLDEINKEALSEVENLTKKLNEYKNKEKERQSAKFSEYRLKKAKIILKKLMLEMIFTTLKCFSIFVIMFLLYYLLECFLEERNQGGMIINITGFLSDLGILTLSFKKLKKWGKKITKIFMLMKRINLKSKIIRGGGYLEYQY